MNLLITGGALGDIPTIIAAKELGHYVITSGNRPNDPGHQYSDRYENADYTNSLEIARVSSENKVRTIIPSCHDRAAIAASEAADLLQISNLDSAKVATLIHNKNLLRNHMKKIGMNVPESRVCNSIEDLMRFMNHLGKKLIIKPLTLTGGRGVSTVSNAEEAFRGIEILRENNTAEKFIAEEYLIGSYHGFSTLIENCHVKFYFSDTEGFKPNKFRVERTISKSNFTEVQINQVIGQVELFAESLRLKDGILHCQTINVGGKIYILEICRRTPGDLYPWFCEMATGVDLSKKIVESATDSEMSVSVDLKIDSDVCRVIVTPESSGIFSSIEKTTTPQNVTKSTFTTRFLGETIVSPSEWNAEVNFFIGDTNEIEEIFLNYKTIVVVGH